jgi:EAL domain-containing protein (putative c-di-GMP-specific phosphodiesterase class I)
VAEGVEELAQHRLLQELGCDTSQGFYFARPQPAGQLLELLRGGSDLPVKALVPASHPTS